jgi:hypothetical protein
MKQEGRPLAKAPLFLSRRRTSAEALAKPQAEGRTAGADVRGRPSLLEQVPQHDLEAVDVAEAGSRFQ